MNPPRALGRPGLQVCITGYNEYQAHQMKGLEGVKRLAQLSGCSQEQIRFKSEAIRQTGNGVEVHCLTWEVADLDTKNMIIAMFNLQHQLPDHPTAQTAQTAEVDMMASQYVFGEFGKELVMEGVNQKMTILGLVASLSPIGTPLYIDVARKHQGIIVLRFLDIHSYALFTSSPPEPSAMYDPTMLELIGVTRRTTAHECETIIKELLSSIEGARYTEKEIKVGPSVQDPYATVRFATREQAEEGLRRFPARVRRLRVFAGFGKGSGVLKVSFCSVLEEIARG